MRNAVPTVAALALACGGALPQNPDPAAQNLEARPPRATVVLIHGMGGWSSIDGVDYFYQVPELWRSLRSHLVRRLGSLGAPRPAPGILAKIAFR